MSDAPASTQAQDADRLADGQAVATPAQLLQLAKERGERIRSTMVKSRGASQLPLFDERFRGLPNTLARSALFTCRGKAVARMQLKRAPIATVGQDAIFQTGEELRQLDLDVFLQSSHLGGSAVLGEFFEVSAYQFLKRLGWGTSTRDYARLRSCITRLTETTIWVTFGNGASGFSGRLIDKVEWSDAGSGSRERWRFRLDPTIMALFDPDGISLLEFETRLSLRDMAKWLHGYFVTHRDPLPVSVGALYKWSASSASRLSGFRRDLIGALEELVRVRFLLSFSVDPRTDMVTVRRNLQRQLAAA